MYINFKKLLGDNKLLGKGLDLSRVAMVLLVAKQNSYESNDYKKHDFNCSLTKEVDTLLELDFVKFLKKDKGKKELSNLRLTDGGKKFINVLSEDSTVEKEDEVVFEWLAKKYRDSGRQIGNQRKTKIYIALFRRSSGITKNCLVTLCKSFLEDDNYFEYSKCLEYVFFKPKNVYSTKFEVNDSKLYQYYLSKKGYFDSIFAKMNVKNIG